ncbi:unnamed protein product [Staurois parvus]|uniref:Uncharacterized protein n=1 Tax=Staurois parvus TaxID=386267 RepID=A0ABN9EGP9_9NEOB|nr:unnamed protein product [Staurois parvus]
MCWHSRSHCHMSPGGDKDTVTVLRNLPTTSLLLSGTAWDTQRRRSLYDRPLPSPLLFSKFSNPSLKKKDQNLFSGGWVLT